MFDESTPEFVRRLEELFSRATDAFSRRKALDRLHQVEKRIDVSKNSIKFLWDLCFDGLVLDYAACWDESKKTKGSIPKLTCRLCCSNKKDFARFTGETGDFGQREAIAERVNSIQAKVSSHLKIIFDLRNEYFAHLGKSGVVKHPTIPTKSLTVVQEQTFLALNTLGEIVGRVASVDSFSNAGVELINKLPMVSDQSRDK